MDDERRVALVENRTVGQDPAPERLVRYQLDDHLGSASLELDDQARVISYEEYAPYGSSTYAAVRSRTEAPKRYRFTGKERDEETGLAYHGARYYAPWLGRWVSCDPAGLADGLNLYQYVSSRPTVLHDPSGHKGATLSDSDKTTVGVDKNNDIIVIFGDVDVSKIPKVSPGKAGRSHPAEAKPPPPPAPEPPAPPAPPAPPPPKPPDETKPFDPYAQGVGLDTSWRTGGSNYLWSGTKELFNAAQDSSFSAPERVAFLGASWLGLLGSGLEQLVVNPLLNAPANAYESGQLGARSVHHLSRGEYGAAIKDAGEAKDKFEESVTAVTAVVLPFAGGEKAAASRTATASESAIAKLTAVEKADLRTQARVLLRQQGRRLMPWHEVHHRVPLEYSHLFADAGPEAYRGMLNPNRMENLRVLTKFAHYDVHRAWTTVRNMGRPITAKSVMRYEKLFAKNLGWRCMW